MYRVIIDLKNVVKRFLNLKRKRFFSSLTLQLLRFVSKCNGDLTVRLRSQRWGHSMDSQVGIYSI